MQMETMLRGSHGMQGEANLMHEKFAAIQEAFSDPLSDATSSENRPRPPFHHSGKL
jgi:hypothetical protein